MEEKSNVLILEFWPPIVSARPGFIRPLIRALIRADFKEGKLRGRARRGGAPPHFEKRSPDPQKLFDFYYRGNYNIPSKE
jgi:hypothetical protein